MKIFKFETYKINMSLRFGEVLESIKYGIVKKIRLKELMDIFSPLRSILSLEYLVYKNVRLFMFK